MKLIKNGSKISLIVGLFFTFFLFNRNCVAMDAAYKQIAFKQSVGPKYCYRDALRKINKLSVDLGALADVNGFIHDISNLNKCADDLWDLFSYIDENDNAIRRVEMGPFYADNLWDLAHCLHNILAEKYQVEFEKKEPRN